MKSRSGTPGRLFVCCLVIGFSGERLCRYSIRRPGPGRRIGALETRTDLFSGLVSSGFLISVW